MSQLHKPKASPSWDGRRELALGCGLIAVSVPAALAAAGVRWQLEASVPVICAILSVEARNDQIAGIAVATSCNAERYQLNVTRSGGPAGLRAARSSAGLVQISGSAITITSNRPGYALTTIELAEPIGAQPFSVTLQPL